MFTPVVDVNLIKPPARGRKNRTCDLAGEICDFWVWLELESLFPFSQTVSANSRFSPEIFSF